MAGSLNTPTSVADRQGRRTHGQRAGIAKPHFESSRPKIDITTADTEKTGLRETCSQLESINCFFVFLRLCGYFLVCVVALQVESFRRGRWLRLDYFRLPVEVRLKVCGEQLLFPLGKSFESG